MNQQAFTPPTEVKAPEMAAPPVQTEGGVSFPKHPLVFDAWDQDVCLAFGLSIKDLYVLKCILDYRLRPYSSEIASYSRRISADWPILELQPVNVFSIIQKLVSKRVLELDCGILRAGPKMRVLYESGYGDTGLYEAVARGCSGHVYVLRDEATGLMKIGRATNIKNRLSAINTGSPTGITLVYSFEASDCQLHESVLHERYAEKRVRNEWFSLSESDVKDIIEYGGSAT